MHISASQVFYIFYYRFNTADLNYVIANTWGVTHGKGDYLHRAIPGIRLITTEEIVDHIKIKLGQF